MSSDNPVLLYYDNGGILTESYYIEDDNVTGDFLFHRECGPAYTRYSNSGKIEYQSWYLNGEQHRTTGPASIHYYPSGEIHFEHWYLNSRKHRTDGPATVQYNKFEKIIQESWWLNGKAVYPYEWLKENGHKWPLTKEQETEFLLVFR